jgi:hypothetical protein
MPAGFFEMCAALDNLVQPKFIRDISRPVIMYVEHDNVYWETYVVTPVRPHLLMEPAYMSRDNANANRFMIDGMSGWTVYA